MTSYSVRKPDADGRPVTFVGQGKVPPNVQMVKISDIKVDWSKRRRTDPVIVQELMEDIAERGLLQPLVLYKIANQPELFLGGGGHRLEAEINLGREFVPATIIEVADEEAGRDIQDSENLIRNELTKFERCVIHLRKKRRYLRRHPEAGRGGDRRSPEIKNRALIGSYASIATKETGEAERTIEEEARIGSILEPYSNMILGSPIEDSMTDLRELAQLQESDIFRVLNLITSGSAQKVSQARKILLEPGAAIKLTDKAPTQHIEFPELKIDNLVLRNLGTIMVLFLKELQTAGFSTEKADRALEL